MTSLRQGGTRRRDGGPVGSARLAALVLLAAVFGPALPGWAQRDVLLITLDTTRADHLSCYGYPLKTTPALDDFARQAVKFTRAYTPVPYTLPSHSTMMTGLWPRDHGVRDNLVTPMHSDIPVAAALLQTAGYRTAAFVSAFVLDHHFGLNRGFGTYDDAMTMKSDDDKEEYERLAPDTAKRVVEYLAGLRAGNPVFLWVHFYDPHSQYREHPDTPLGMGPYDGELRFMDRSIGRVLEAWRARRGGLVIIAGDHGESLGDHGESFHGVFLYEPTVRVPLLVQSPAGTSGKVDDRLVCLTDVAATILEFARVPAPPMAGKSLLSPGTLHDRIYFESLVAANNWGWSPGFGILMGGFKYIHLPKPELYQVAEDPGEEDNRAEGSRPRARELRDRLQKEYGTRYVPPEGLPNQETVKRLEALGYRGGSRAHMDKDPKDLVWLVDEMDRGRARVREGDYGAAEKAFREILGINPENSPIRVDYFAMLRRLGRRSEAREVLMRGLDYDPFDTFVLYNLGVLDFEEDRLEVARKRFDTVLLLSPEQQDSLLYLFWIALKKGDGAGARAFLNRAERADPENPNIEFFRGLMAAHLGDLDRAVVHFKACLKLKSKEKDALNSLGQAYFLMQRFDASVDAYKKSLSADPDQPEIYLHLGTILLNSIKDPAAALGYFRDFLSRYPRDAQAPQVREVVEEIGAPRP
jgi:choline-sulfatase